jgi:hypothetical protein
MSWLQYLKRLYSLDTLDTRCVIPSTTPPRQAATELQLGPEGPSNSRGSNSRTNGGLQDGVKPSQWKTPEFYLYYIVFIVAVPMMFKVSFDVSKCSFIPFLFHQTYTKSRGSISSKLSKVFTSTG